MRRAAHPEFDISLAYGQQREGEFGQILAAKGDAVEVKSDDAARRTGNLFVELFARPLPLLGMRDGWAAWGNEA